MADKTQITGSAGHSESTKKVSFTGGVGASYKMPADPTWAAVGGAVKNLAGLIPIVLKAQKTSALNKSYRDLDSQLEGMITKGLGFNERRIFKQKWAKEQIDGGVSHEIVNEVMRLRTLRETKTQTKEGVKYQLGPQGEILGQTPGARKSRPETRAVHSVAANLATAKIDFPRASDTLEETLLARLPETKENAMHGAVLTTKFKGIHDIINTIEVHGLGYGHTNIEDFEVARGDNSTKLRGAIHELSNSFIATPIARALDDPNNMLSKGDILTTWNAAVADIYSNFNQNSDLYKYSLNATQLAETIKTAGDRLSGQIDFLTGSTARTYEIKAAAIAGYNKAQQYLGDVALIQKWESSKDPFLKRQAEMVRKQRMGYYTAMGEMIQALEKAGDPAGVKGMIIDLFTEDVRANGESILRGIESAQSEGTKLGKDPTYVEKSLNRLLTSLLGVGDSTFAGRLERQTNLYIKFLRDHPEGGGAYQDGASRLEGKLKRYLDNLKIGAKLK